MSNGLKRSIGLFSSVNIVVANMIGAGIFTTSGLLMNNLGNPFLMLILWALGGIIALFGALSYGKLGALIPEAGGEYIFLSKIYHPLFGFLSGWVSLIVGFSTAIAASAIGFSEYLSSAFSLESLLSDHYILFKRLISILIILLFTLIHLRGIVIGAKIQNLLTILKIVLVIGLIIAGFSFGQGNFSDLKINWNFNKDINSFKTMGLSLMWIMFAYSGWNAATYIGSEIKRPEKNLPLSLLSGTFIVIVLYLLLNLFFIYSTPVESMKGEISIASLAASNAFGSAFKPIIAILIAFALFSSLSAFIILGPRVYYAMARDGYFFKFAAQLHPTYKVPSKAIILQAAISIIMVLSGTFDQILTYLGFALSIFPILTVLAIYKLKYDIMKSGKSSIIDDAKTSPKNIKFNLSDIYLIGYVIPSLLMLIFAFMERPMESSIAIGTILVGILAFYLFLRSN